MRCHCWSLCRPDSSDSSSGKPLSYAGHAIDDHSYRASFLKPACVGVSLLRRGAFKPSPRLACNHVPLTYIYIYVCLYVLFLTSRSKGQGPKAYSTARSFCSEALSAAVDCGRQLVRREGAAAVIAEKPRWFLDSFVVAMASPLLLGDAVGALRAASAASVEGAGGKEEEEEEDVAGALRDVVLPGAVDRLTKVSGRSRFLWLWSPRVGIEGRSRGGTGMMYGRGFGDVVPCSVMMTLSVVRGLVCLKLSSRPRRTERDTCPPCPAQHRTPCISSGVGEHRQIQRGSCDRSAQSDVLASKGGRRRNAPVS